MANPSRKQLIWPYRLYLNPLLHKQFTKAALLLLAVCYVQAVLTGDFWRFWNAFSFFTLLRTLLFFVSSMAVFLLRLSQLHVGQRTGASPIATLRTYVNSLNGFAQSVRTVIAYILSSVLFVEAYLFTVSEERDLGWVHHGGPRDHDTLNERPLFLRSVCHSLAVLQALHHLRRDLDRIRLPTSKGQTKPERTKLSQLYTYVDAIHTFTRTFMGTILCSIFYFVIPRSIYWNFFRNISKAMFFDVSRVSEPAVLPYRFPTILMITLGVGFAQSLIWDICNAYFSGLLARPPLKKDSPLSDESKDPNGTLLIGLGAKNEIQKCFAFWELALITSFYGQRRKSIFEDIDRPKGSAWKQVVNASLTEIVGIDKRISQYQNPAPPTPSTALTSEPVKMLPRISAPLREDDVFVPGKSTTVGVDGITRTGIDAFQKFAKSRGSSTDPASPKKLLEYGTQKLQGIEGRAQATSSGAASIYTSVIIKNPYLGWIFQRTFARRARVIILGGPYSRADTIVDASLALSNLVVHSLKEDRFGQVQKDVPAIIYALTNTIKTTEIFLQQLEPHLSDIAFNPAEDRKVTEVDDVLKALKKSLREIVMQFGEFVEGMGMRREELMDAKRLLLEDEREMQQLASKSTGSLARLN